MQWRHCKRMDDSRNSAIFVGLRRYNGMYTNDRPKLHANHTTDIVVTVTRQVYISARLFAMKAEMTYLTVFVQRFLYLRIS